jgi:tetratricopeptide (TPR) repeat protein
MPLLRLTQHIENEDQYRIEIAFEDDDGSRQTADVRFSYQFTKQDRTDMRWYLEDYLQYPLDPAPQIAHRIEERMREIGSELYEQIFSNRDAIKLWGRLQASTLSNVRVEILTSVEDAVNIPWELLRDPDTDIPLALEAGSFVRSPVNPARLPNLLAYQPDKVRILLVICRPGGRSDVPFRSVAGKFIKGLDEKAWERFDLDVLRPPTFEQLGKALRGAKAEGNPYHIVHFDGHGAYVDFENSKREFNFSPLVFSVSREGMHGYLLFENPKYENNIEWVDGPALGNLLVEADVPVLVLNACRSAHADIQQQPAAVEDVHSQVRAFGSLAQEVMDAGVAGVVAMRYNVYVVTAAQFVADLYAALAAGQTLGEAVSMGRKQLAAQPLREIAFEPRPLQDWSVPVVYEAAPISLFPKQSGAGVGRGLGAGTAPIRIDITKTARPADDLPRPDVGFYGRDETLLALDRAFDTQKVVLLHAYAGSGKTMTAAEFARWYSQTGGLDGPVLFTSFERYKPLERVLDTIGQVFGPTLENSGIQWLALSDEERLNVTTQVLKQIPVLWIWDNVEPVSGFPAGAASAWSEKEQLELKNFLGNMSALTKAKFLLTSRREERAWLGELPARVTLPPMPVQERVQLARALADKFGKKMTIVEDWMPLLEFTQGNPLTLTVLVGQALRDKLKIKAQVYEYVNKLRAGEAAFADETSEGRSKSLGASLLYGFESAFSEEERKILALLHFFQGFLDIDSLKLMVADKDWGIGSQNFTREKGVTLLDKATEIGLLSTHGSGYYTIHPALPWFFRELFEQYYPDDDRPLIVDNETTVHGPLSILARRAFVESMCVLGANYHNQYEGGNRDVIAPLRAEEPNLLHARHLARQHQWWGALIGIMQGLRTLYGHTGRRAEWKRLVEEIVPDFVDIDNLPLPGRDEQWGFITEYRVHLAMETRDWSEAEYLQNKHVEWERERVASFLAVTPEALSENERKTLHSLGTSLHDLGQIKRELGHFDCIQVYQEAAEIMQRIGDTSAAASIAIDLGHAYKNLTALRNLEQAEKWYRKSLELFSQNDRVGRAKSYMQLGFVAYETFHEARQEKASTNELLKHLNTAVNYYQQALALLPNDAVDDLAVLHNHLGNLYLDTGDFEQVLFNYNKAVKFSEASGNYYFAAQVQNNLAIALARNGRLSDALLYARASLRNFESYGQGTKENVHRVNQLVDYIENDLVGAGN